MTSIKIQCYVKNKKIKKEKGGKIIYFLIYLSFSFNRQINSTLVTPNFEAWIPYQDELFDCEAIIWDISDVIILCIC